MKKLLLLLICLLIPLTACGEKGKADSQSGESAGSDGISEAADGEAQSDDAEYDGKRYGSSIAISNDGELFIDSQVRLNFFDFSIMDSVLICSKPNCRHDTHDCSSYGMDIDPFIYNGNIYFFEADSYMKKDKPVYNMHFVRADIDGTNRKVLLTLEDMEDSSDCLLIGSTLYFGMRTHGYTDLSLDHSEPTAKLFSYDLESGQLSELFSMKKGYSCAIQIDGEYNGDIYFTVSYLEEKFVYDPNNIPTSLRETFKYNRQNNEISERDGDYYPCECGLVHYEDEGATFYTEDGKEIYIPDITQNSTYVSIIDGYIIDGENKFAVEISSGDRYSVSGIDKSDDIIYCLDGAYIVKRLNKDSGQYEYRKLVWSDIIGKEI